MYEVQLHCLPPHPTASMLYAFSRILESYDLTILNKASSLGGKNFHRFFGGLHLTHNGVYAVYVES